MSSALQKMHTSENPYGETPSPKRKLTRGISQNSLKGKVKNGSVDRPLSAVRASLAASVFKRVQSANKLAGMPALN